MRLTYTDRLYIEKYQTTLSKRQLAQDIGCCLKTIYNEFARGGYWHTDTCLVDYWRYSADIAQQDYDFKATAKGCPPKLGKHWDFIQHIEDRILRHKESPAVALRHWRKCHAWTVSLTTLYRYIESGLYFPNLTSGHLWEHKPKRPYHRINASRPPKGTSIEKRPPAVSSRTTFGHWEMDSVVGKAKGTRQSLLVLTERLSRYELIFRVPNKSASAVVSTLSKLATRPGFRDVFKTITVDNGPEFQDVKGMEALGVKIYYCHPYASCERGTNERMNRMIRRFFPKGRSLYKVTQRNCDEVKDWLNWYPRKVLDWQAPIDLWRQHTSVDPY